MIWKKIYLNTQKTKHCNVRLYRTKKEMRDGIRKYRSYEKQIDQIAGCCCPYTRYNIGTRTARPDVAKVFLSIQDCGAGIVTHELLHAVLWAWKHSFRKKQHPILIKDMNDEEEILHNHTFAVKQFYNWFFENKKRLLHSVKH
ncbi:MAG TPA: hypothetical protein VK616_18350 [Flavitalea sp.]|nr:hypothetical protein [Flavitalea sp.]